MRQKQFVTRMFGEAITERMRELNMSKADLTRPQRFQGQH